MLSVEQKKSAWNNAEVELHVICSDCASSAPIYIWNKRNEEVEQPKLAVIR
ncbi:hypothetical protein [Vibrio sp. F74]|uniref:hypothetical protein n=1 Tax=Vibrio sp. F74 TaxID=700020 RepID=UPI0036F328EF